MTIGYYGALPKTEDRRDYLAKPPTAFTGAFVDLSAGFPEAPYDQLRLGSCVPNGTAAAVDFALAKEGGQPLRRPSRLFVYYQGRVRGGYPIGQDSGLQIRDGFSVIAKDGAPSEAIWPYDITRFTEKPPAAAYDAAKYDVAVAYGAVADGDIDNVIASGWPVVIGFDVYESFESQQTASTGIMPVPKRGEQLLGGHCVVVCSTPKGGSQIPGGVPGVWYRLCRNSRGHDGTWGLPDRPGYFWFPVSVMDSSAASDFWQVTTVASTAAPTPPPAPVPNPVFDILSAILVKVEAIAADIKAFFGHLG